MSYTPGPWKAVSEAVAREVDVFEVAEISHFRVIYAGGGDGFGVAGDPFSDARLIAAAPDLLLALREIAEDYEDRFDMESPSTNPGIKSSVKRSRAAIAKATGDAA